MIISTGSLGKLAISRQQSAIRIVGAGFRCLHGLGNPTPTKLESQKNELANDSYES